MESFQQLELTKKRHSKQTTHKTRSRRISQRRKQRLIKKESGKSYRTNIGFGRINRTTQYCLQNFGLCSNPDNSINKNFKTALQTIPSHTWLQPRNLTFHNLCKQQKLPLGTKELLGLNLKFCISSNKITNDINKTVLLMAKIRHGGGSRMVVFRPFWEVVRCGLSFLAVKMSASFFRSASYFRL